jgi:methyl-accepting chemotaxis protein PixJ
MLKNLFGSAEDKDEAIKMDKSSDTLNPALSKEPQMLTPLDRNSMNSNTAKQQLLSILQDAQVKLENSNSSNAEPLRQNLRKARELAGFLTAPSGLE